MKSRTALRLGATAVAALVVAEAAAWLLRPKDVIEPVSASEDAYFTHEQLQRASDFRSGQRLLMFGGLAAEGGLLVLLVAGKPEVARRALVRAGERPVLGGAAVAAGLYLAISLAPLPFALAAHERSVDVGLSTQDIGGWALDWAKSTAVGAAIAGVVGSAALALMRRFGRRWWLPGSAAFIALSVVFVWLAPVVLAPLFNKFEKLGPGQARADVLELGRRAGVDIGEVYRVDASRRSTAINAYVNGIGSTKQVVLYDTLLKDLGRGERRSVIAHELGHVADHDLRRGLVFLAIVTPLALLFASALAQALARRRGVEPGTPEYLPALALALVVTSFAIGVVGNQLSRAVEAKADTTALELTDDPGALIGLQRRLAITNVGDPDPPGWVTLLFGTHPSTIERIGEALAWQRGERP